MIQAVSRSAQSSPRLIPGSQSSYSSGSVLAFSPSGIDSPLSESPHRLTALSGLAISSVAPTTDGAMTAVGDRYISTIVPAVTPAAASALTTPACEVDDDSDQDDDGEFILSSSALKTGSFSSVSGVAAAARFDPAPATLPSERYPSPSRFFAIASPAPSMTVTGPPTSPTQAVTVAPSPQPLDANQLSLWDAAGAQARIALTTFARARQTAEVERRRSLKQLVAQAELGLGRTEARAPLAASLDDVAAAALNTASLEQSQSPSQLTLDSRAGAAASVASGPAPAWLPDHSSPVCLGCRVPFTLRLRRHHCRRCGLLLCGDCAPHFARIRSFAADASPQRVCRDCRTCA